MERTNESSPNDDGSSPDTVIGRSSSEEDDKHRRDEAKKGHSTSGEYMTGIGESSSSLDTVIASIDHRRYPRQGQRQADFIVESPSSNASEQIGKKKGRFQVLKNTFRKIKKTKSRSTDSSEISSYGDCPPPDNDDDVDDDNDNDNDNDEGSKASSSESKRQLAEAGENSASSDAVRGISGITTAAATGKKKKKRNSLVGKLSLNKFRLGSNEHQERSEKQHLRETTRHTPEGGDSSRSRSQSSQESTTINASSPSSGQEKIRHRHREVDCACTSNDEAATLEKRRSPSDRRDEAGKRADVSRSTIEREKGSGIANQRIETARARHRDTSERQHHRKNETKPYEKTLSTVTVVQRRSPSLTIRTNFHREKHGVEEQEREREESEENPIQRSVSTLPYAISKWRDNTKLRVEEASESSRKPKYLGKSDSESTVKTATTPTTPPIELRRKLSLLEEKRAIFQRRRYETSQDSSYEVSGDTVVAASIESTTEKDSHDKEESRVKRARHISVRKFDTFSTFEGTFDEDAGVGYLAGIEEVHGEQHYFPERRYERDESDIVDDYEDPGGAMQQQQGIDYPDKSISISQESASSQNNAPNTGIGEKREHLYKILVIGELGAGKTSIIKRYVHQFFSQHYRATIGVDFALKVLNWDPHTIIRLQLWDIAGQERFGNMTRVYYKEAVGAFIVFDVTRSATLEAVVKWKQDLDSKVQLPDGSPIPCVLLANKCDQQKEGLVNTPSKMDDYCKEKNFSGWFETSAKENINIEEAARFLVKKILQNDQIMKGNGSQDQTDGERFALNQSPTSSKKSCPC